MVRRNPRNRVISASSQARGLPSSGRTVFPGVLRCAPGTGPARAVASASRPAAGRSAGTRDGRAGAAGAAGRNSGTAGTTGITAGRTSGTRTGHGTGMTDWSTRGSFAESGDFSQKNQSSPGNPASPGTTRAVTLTRPRRDPNAIPGHSSRRRRTRHPVLTSSNSLHAQASIDFADALAAVPQMTALGAARMWQAIVFGFLGGVLGANGFPHLTRGITKRRYPCGLGNGTVPNFVAGRAAFVIAALLC